MIRLDKDNTVFIENINELAFLPKSSEHLRRYAFIDWINSTDTHIVFKGHFGYEVYSKLHQKSDIYKKHLERCELPPISEEHFQDMTALMLFMKKEILEKGYTLKDIENNQNVPHHDLPFVHTEQQIQEMHARVCE